MAFPVTLNGRTYTLADFEGTNYVDGLPDAFEDFVTHAGAIYKTTSTTSNTIGTGSKSFTTADNSLPYQVGTPLRITDSAAPSTNWMDGIVTAYSGTSLTVNVVGYAGSGTKTSWNINIGGGPNTVSGTLPVAQGGTGATTAGAAATNLGLGTGDSPTFSGVNLGDNNKAIFGAGSDLQIYHSGSHSYIDDTGTGNLIIRASSALSLQKYTGEIMAQLTADGAVDLYYDNATKLATTSTGIDVTGSVTADGLTVQNDTANFNGTNYTYTGTNYDIYSLHGSGTGIRLGSDSVTGAGVVGGVGANDIDFVTYSGSAWLKRAKIGYNGDISFYDSTGTSQDFFWDASASRLGIGTTTSALGASIKLNLDGSNGGGLQLTNNNNGGGAIIPLNAGGQTFYTFTGAVGAESYSERMRIDSSGNLLVGKTAVNTAANGGELRANGQILAIATDINPFFAARLNSDGDLFVFRKDATTVGSIGTQGGEPYIGLGDVAVKFHPGLDAIMPWSIDANNWRDNAISLGRPTAYRFDDAYIVNGVTTGSDGNEKQDIAELDEAEKRVALAAKSLVRKYRWIDAVEKKGDDARIHVGVIAQDLKAAFEAEGLDAHRYGMFMSNTYWMADETLPAIEEELDEEGNVITEAKPERIVQRVYEGDQEVPEGATEHVRLGVRYPELLAFIISAI